MNFPTIICALAPSEFRRRMIGCTVLIVFYVLMVGAICPDHQNEADCKAATDSSCSTNGCEWVEQTKSTSTSPTATTDDSSTLSTTLSISDAMKTTTAVTKDTLLKYIAFSFPTNLFLSRRQLRCRHRWLVLRVRSTHHASNASMLLGACLKLVIINCSSPPPTVSSFVLSV